MEEKDMKDKKHSKEEQSAPSYHVEDFFEEVVEYLDEVARGDILTANKEENGVVQMMFYTDDDEELLAGKTHTEAEQENKR